MRQTRVMLLSVASVLVLAAAYAQNPQPCAENTTVSPSLSMESLKSQITVLQLHLAKARVVHDPSRISLRRELFYKDDQPGLRRLEAQQQALRDQYKALAK